jgi:hypothetical protein
LEQIPPPLDIPKELFTMVDFIKRKGAQEVSSPLPSKKQPY